MATSEDPVNNSHRNHSTGEDENVRSDFSLQEAQLKKEKARAKSNFTRCRHRLLLLIENEDLPSRRAVREVCEKLDNYMEIAMEVILRLSDLYSSFKESEKCKAVTSELEKLESEFSAASDSARDYLESRKFEQSSVLSETLHIDLMHGMNINDEVNIYQQEQQKQAANPEISESDNIVLANSKNIWRAPEIKYNSFRYLDTRGGNCESNECRVRSVDARTPTDSVIQDIFNESATQAKTVPLATGITPSSGIMPSIGQDLWKQLKRVQIPVFSGDKRSYQSWKAAFIACIDNAPATAEYKLLQLRQYLSGEALKVIDNLGHSAVAYEAAKERLERKYGGKRRQIALYLDELEQFRQVRTGNAKDIEQFADLLDIALINLKEAGQHQELGDGSLYTKLQRKLPESMLARYHRWIFENNKSESVVSLRTWVLQEAEFQTVAAETVHGLSGKSGNSDATKSFPRTQNQRSFLVEQRVVMLSEM